MPAQLRRSLSSTGGERPSRATNGSFYRTDDSRTGVERTSIPRQQREDSAARMRATLESMHQTASARAREIAKIRRASGRVPDLEEGVDPNDISQDVPIETLKERIHRELEEYRRTGPIMQRKVSKAGVVTTTFAAPKPRQLMPPPSRDPERSPIQRGLPQRSEPVRQAGERGRALQREPRDPMMKARHPTRSQPPASSAQAAKAKQQQTYSRAISAPAPSRGDGQAPVWMRLYQDATVQQERMKQRREQQREVEAARHRGLLRPSRSVQRPPQPWRVVGPPSSNPNQNTRQPRPWKPIAMQDGQSAQDLSLSHPGPKGKPDIADCNTLKKPKRTPKSSAAPKPYSTIEPPSFNTLSAPKPKMTKGYGAPKASSKRPHKPRPVKPSSTPTVEALEPVVAQPPTSPPPPTLPTPPPPEHEEDEVEEDPDVEPTRETKSFEDGRPTLDVDFDDEDDEDDDYGEQPIPSCIRPLDLTRIRR